MKQDREDELLSAINKLANTLQLSVQGLHVNRRVSDECFALAEDLTEGTPHEFKVRR